MAVYLVVNYEVTNPEGFASYPEAARKTLADAGAEVVAVDMESEILEGEARPVTVILKFESRDAMKAWYDSPEYQAVKDLRTDNSEGIMVLVQG